MTNELHWMGDGITITGHRFEVSRELSDAMNEILDAAESGDASRIMAAIESYETASRPDAAVTEAV